MSLFTEYEKLRTAKKDLTKGSKWEVTIETYGANGRNTVGNTVYISRVTVGNVWYCDHRLELNTDRNHHSRDIEIFKRTFRPVL